jgi:hypothetical protein
MPFQSDASLTRRASDRAINVDVLFPMLHGTFGQKGIFGRSTVFADHKLGAIL